MVCRLARSVNEACGLAYASRQFALIETGPFQKGVAEHVDRAVRYAHGGVRVTRAHLLGEHQQKCSLAPKQNLFAPGRALDEVVHPCTSVKWDQAMLLYPYRRN